jgi:hypothetical protein
MAKCLVLLASLGVLSVACASTLDHVVEPTNLLPDVTPFTEAPSGAPTTDTAESTTQVAIATPSFIPTPLPRPTATDPPSASPSLTPAAENLETDRLQTQKGRVRLYRSLVHPAESRLDLDTGQVTGPENLDADIEYFTSVGSMVFDFLRTVNEAKAQEFPSDLFGYEDCQEHQGELAQTMMMNFYTGTVCVLTNQGRLSTLRLIREGEDWVELVFTTWDQIVTP